MCAPVGNKTNVVNLWAFYGMSLNVMNRLLVREITLITRSKSTNKRGFNDLDVTFSKYILGRNDDQ